MRAPKNPAFPGPVTTVPRRPRRPALVLTLPLISRGPHGANSNSEPHSGREVTALSVDSLTCAARKGGFERTEVRKAERGRGGCVQQTETDVRLAKNHTHGVVEIGPRVKTRARAGGTAARAACPRRSAHTIAVHFAVRTWMAIGNPVLSMREALQAEQQAGPRGGTREPGHGAIELGGSKDTFSTIRAVKAYTITNV